MAFGWEEMLGEFRRLGGTADNLVQRQGSRGRGLFPIDNTKPVRLRVPENLLIPAEDIEFVDDELRIRDSAAVGAAEREFIEEYEKEFSWGGGGRSDCAAFLEGMKKLHLAMPPRSLSTPFVGWMAGAMPESPAKRFLQSRAINYRDKLVLMPLMELVNHGPDAKGYDKTDGVSISGQFPDEILVRYCIHDPLAIFMSYGFATPARRAFCLPFDTHRGLIVQRNINLKAKIGSFDVPEFSIKGEEVTLSALMIGDSNAPRVPKSIFLKIMDQVGWKDPLEQFEYKCHQNRMIYFDLLEIVEAQEGDFALTVQKMLRFQLQAMSYCFGTRTL